jgi:mitochondrial fission protein ELM1
MSQPVWAISDGAAGNERQAVALARALGAAEPRVLQLTARVPWRWFSPRAIAGARYAFGGEFARLLRGPLPGAAVGCGRQAALALQLLRRASNGACRTVQILDPRIEPDQFDAVVAPAHDGLQEDNVVITRGALNDIDDAWLARARDAWPQFAHLPAPRTVLLLGGSTRALPFDEAYWRALATRLGQWLTRDGGSLLVTSSRRSPDWLREAARAEFSAVPGLQWHGEDDGPNPYPGLLAWADRIVVTPDSVNLLSEACATRVPVFALADAPLKGKLDVFLRELVTMGRVRIMQQEPERWAVQPMREMPRVAAEVRRLLKG